MTEEETLPNLFLKSEHYLDTKAIYGHYKRRKLPIFLMNTDTKFFGTIIANQIQQYTKSIIYHSQVGFISEMQKRFIIGKLITVIYHSKRMKDKNLVIIPRDAKKKII